MIKESIENNDKLREKSVVSTEEPSEKDVSPLSVKYGSFYSRPQ